MQPNLLWITLFAFPLFVSIQPVSGYSTKECFAIDQCSCKMHDGSMIDLWPIDFKNGPRFSEELKGITYQYNPCTPFTLGSSGQCKNALICRSDTKVIGSQPVALAFPNDMVSSYGQNFNGYTFSYTGNSIDNQNKYRGIVKLLCDSNAVTPSITNFLEGPSYTFTTTLTSKYACPVGSKGLSAGSILCILFFSLLLVYFVSGILLKKFVAHKEGSDVIPNKSFWIVLPGYTKDGFLFAFRMIRGKGSQYEKL